MNHLSSQESEAWYTYNEDDLEESRTGTEWDHGDPWYDYVWVFEYDEAGRKVKGIYDYTSLHTIPRDREETLVWDCPGRQQ